MNKNVLKVTNHSYGDFAKKGIFDVSLPYKRVKKVKFAVIFITSMTWMMYLKRNYSLLDSRPLKIARFDPNINQKHCLPVSSWCHQRYYIDSRNNEWFAWNDFKTDSDKIIASSAQSKSDAVKISNKMHEIKAIHAIWRMRTLFLAMKSNSCQMHIVVCMMYMYITVFVSMCRWNFSGFLFTHIVATCVFVRSLVPLGWPTN